MHVNERENFLMNVQHALTLPISTRCAELTVLLDRGSLMELHSFFPVLIDNIFGPQGTMCWGLRSTSESQSEEFRQLRHFLSPCGPIFKLIYTLLKDSNIKYDFSLGYLPIKIRQFLDNSMDHPFYSELVHVNLHTKQIMSLLLNPFDYYIFHFAYHLINPWQQRTGSLVTSWNTVYYVLCCDYILHFLPTSPDATILPQIYYNGKNPNIPHARVTLPIQGVDPMISGKNPQVLLNPVNFNKKAEEAFQNKLARHHPRNEIWRSETVLTVLADMWLHNDQISDDHSASNLNGSFNKSQSMSLFRYNELPTGEYMRIVRVLIKHLHAFAASAKADDTHLAELKKITLPIIQGKMYIFLRNLIHRWPLDGSFRLVLELWLSYIQPWRYPPHNLIKTRNKTETNPDLEDISIAPQAAVEREHLPFIAENLLSYVVIFQQLIPRFGRVDLVSPKMSFMLYRIAKVFGQPNLSDYLREVEQCVENNRHSPSHPKYASNWPNNLPPLSPTSNWSTNTYIQPKHSSTMLESNKSLSFSPSFINNSHIEKKWSAIVRQKIYELEGPNFCYKPLFSEPPAQEVFDLLIQIKKSINLANELIRLKKEEEHELYGGFWGSIKYFLQAPPATDEFTLSDRKKVPLYLDVSLNNFRQMFHITQEIAEAEPEPIQTLNNSCFEMMNDYKFLTPEKVRSRIKSIKYEGDPDLHPICSDECAFLVRALYQLTCKINETFGRNLYQMYYSNTYTGRLTRQMLCPPMRVFRYDKSLPGSPRIAKDLPPRVSLRFMGSYKFLVYIILGCVFAVIFGYRIETFLLLLITVFILYKSIKAIPPDTVRHNYPTQGFGNISFNDSF